MIVFRGHAVPIFSVPCRAKIFRAMIFRAGPCHKSPGPPCRAVPGRPCQTEPNEWPQMYPFVFGMAWVSEILSD